MIDEAYQELRGLEDEHWWFRGARAVYRTLLSFKPRPGKGARVLEVGSGSGGNFDLLGEFGDVVGLEYSPIAIELTPSAPALGLVRASADALPFAASSFDYVALLGLIEHMDDDRKALREAARVCTHEGIVVLLTSAIAFLWSHHDDANRHRRRYHKKELIELLASAELRTIRVSYQNFFTFLPVLAVRMWQRIHPESPRFDVGKPNRWVNDFLTALLKLEARLIKYISLPVGVDLVAAARPSVRNHD